ncbi:MAG: hypothetical protein AB7P02_23955 [Alphaproteobacteria bacterium]
MIYDPFYDCSLPIEADVRFPDDALAGPAPRSMHDASESPAAKVVRLFGSYEAVREIVGLRSTLQVRRWAYPKSKLGHDGQVPHRHHPALLAAAVERGVPLTAADLMPWLTSPATSAGSSAADAA